MLNIHELEQRWLKYKIKSYIPYLAISFSVGVIFFALFIFLKETPTPIAKNSTQIRTTILKPDSKELTTPKKSLVEKKIAVNITQKKEIPKITREDKPLYKTTNKVILSPSLGFMKKMQTNQQPYYINENSNIHNTIQAEVPTITIVQEEVKNPQITKDKPVQKISITHKNTHNDIAEIISRFKKNNNPALSLFVAKKYYEIGDYRQAYNYALITNQINQDIEVSWIIFAKSLVKLGKKNKAIQTLKQYISQSHSNSAQILLDEIISGKFK